MHQTQIKIQYIKDPHIILVYKFITIGVVVNRSSRYSGSERTGKLAFILAMTADLLGAMAKGQGGLR